VLEQRENIRFFVFHVVLSLMRRIVAVVWVRALKTRSSVMEGTSNLNLRRKLAVQVLIGGFKLRTPVGDESSEKLFFKRTDVRAFELTGVDISELLESIIKEPGLFLVPRNSFSN